MVVATQWIGKLGRIRFGRNTMMIQAAGDEEAVESAQEAKAILGIRCRPGHWRSCRSVPAQLPAKPIETQEIASPVQRNVRRQAGRCAQLQETTGCTGAVLDLYLTNVAQSPAKSALPAQLRYVRSGWHSF